MIECPKEEVKDEDQEEKLTDDPQNNEGKSTENQSNEEKSMDIKDNEEKMQVFLREQPWWNQECEAARIERNRASTNWKKLRISMKKNQRIKYEDSKEKIKRKRSLALKEFKKVVSKAKKDYEMKMNIKKDIVENVINDNKDLKCEIK